MIAMKIGTSVSLKTRSKDASSHCRREQPLTMVGAISVTMVGAISVTMVGAILASLVGAIRIRRWCDPGLRPFGAISMSHRHTLIRTDSRQPDRTDNR